LFFLKGCVLIFAIFRRQHIDKVKKRSQWSHLHVLLLVCFRCQDSTSLQFRVLHSELELEISSWFLSRDEFLRVETRRVERHFFVTFKNFVKRLVPTRFSCFFCNFFCNFSQKLGSERVFVSRDKFGKSSNNSFQP